MRALWLRGVLRRDLLLLRQSPWAMVLSLASTVLGVLVFGLLGRFVGQGTDYVTFVITGITFLRVADAVVQSPGAGLREERTRGSLEVLFDAPPPPWGLVLAGGLVPAVRSLLEGTVAIGLAALLFDVRLSPGVVGLLAVPLAVLAVLLLALTTGLFLAAAGLQSRAAVAATTFFGLAVAMTSEVYYPLHALPGWLQVVARLSPYRVALRGLRDALTGAPGLWGSVAVTLLCAAAVGGAGVLLMNRAVRLARQRGSFQRG